MKLKFLFTGLLAVVLATSCEKDDADEILVKDTPRSETPDALVGKWLNGTFAMSNWWTYDGKNYVGNPYSRSTAFNFSKNGDAEFFLVIKTHTGTCSTEGFTYMKGTVKFDNTNQSFTFYPQRGNYRGFYSCSSGSNFDRTATRDELTPSVYYWTKETDTNGQQWLVIRFSADPGTAGSYFKITNW